MIPPDKNHLKALAGWAISARGNSSNHQHMALCKFQDGCSELAEVSDDLKPVVTTKEKPRTMVKASVATMPVEVQEHLGVGKQDGQCCHKFDITTQMCRFCGISYRKALGRKPELM